MYHDRNLLSHHQFPSMNILELVQSFMKCSTPVFVSEEENGSCEEDGSGEEDLTVWINILSFRVPISKTTTTEECVGINVV